jgi:hypothetical protein
VAETIQQVLMQRARPIRCFALVRMVRVVRAAREQPELAGLRATRDTLARLRSVGPAEITECVDEARRADPTLSPFTLAELDDSGPHP